MQTLEPVAPLIEAPSAISWQAVIAGSVVAAAITLVLLVLGTGLGAATVSPWSNAGISAPTAGALALTWVVIVQWLSSGMGGYVTGRLRRRWANTHTHEVFFRDTAHGFVTWATATLLMGVLLASVALGTAATGVRAAARVGAGAAQSASNAMQGGQVAPYDLDQLFRSSPPHSAASAPSSGSDGRSEAGHILAKGLSDGDVSAADRSYLSALVAANTGLSQDDAQKRVDDVIAQTKSAELKARQAADAARKAAAKASIIAALALVMGAFIASAAAALGGHERDLHP